MEGWLGGVAEEGRVCRWASWSVGGSVGGVSVEQSVVWLARGVGRSAGRVWVYVLVANGGCVGWWAGWWLAHQSSERSIAQLLGRAIHQLIG